jgi:hypothetical protein
MKVDESSSVQSDCTVIRTPIVAAKTAVRPCGGQEVGCRKVDALAEFWDQS